MSKPANLEVVSVPKLKSGDDARAAKELTKRFIDAHNGMRRIAALGLFAWEIKEVHLKHGQWGQWLAAHAPKLCRPDSKTGALKPSASLNSYMQVTKDVLEANGYTVEKYLAFISNSQSLGICRRGNLLLLPDKKVPEEARELREQICATVDGKTAQQLKLGFAQMEEDEDGTPKVKRGRLKGQGGATKEQRAKAAAEEEAGRIAAIELKAEEFSEWLDEKADAKGLGQISGTKAYAKLLKAMENAVGFMHRTNGGAQ